MFEFDFSERETDVPYFYQDKLFLRKIKEGIYQRKYGHYALPLPLKDDELKLSYNKELTF